MKYQIPSSKKNFHSSITHEQLDQVIQAISNGRYSWACVLILRVVGYNPLHFIPQRTYSRLMKEHSQFTTAQLDSQDKLQVNNNNSDSQNATQNFNQSDYIEMAKTQHNSIQDSNVAFYLTSFYPSKAKKVQN